MGKEGDLGLEGACIPDSVVFLGDWDVLAVGDVAGGFREAEAGVIGGRLRRRAGFGGLEAED